MRFFTHSMTSTMLSSIPGTTTLSLLFFLLNQVSSTMAQNSWAIHSGQPSGGSDLCSGKIIDCKQGFLTNGTLPWALGNPQFVRNVNNAGSNPDLGSREQLAHCMTLDKVGDLVKAALGDDTPNGGTCSASSTIWNDVQATSTVIGLGKDQCTAYQSGFAALGDSCESTIGALKYALIYWGAIIGGTIAVFALGIYAKRKYHQYRQSNSHSSINEGTPYHSMGETERCCGISCC